MTTKKPILVCVEPTPNPQSMKFTLNKKIADEVWETTNIRTADRSPLAQKILGFPWALKVFIGSNFITISKESWVEWEVLKTPLSELIQEHINNNLVVLHPKVTKQNKITSENKSIGVNSKTIDKIKHILKNQVQPAVAMDGGFISFVDYKNGTVFLKMQGACAGCPSSSVTLKQGIQTLLQKEVPEVKEVVSI